MFGDEIIGAIWTAVRDVKPTLTGYGIQSVPFALQPARIVAKDAQRGGAFQCFPFHHTTRLECAGLVVDEGWSGGGRIREASKVTVKTKQGKLKKAGLGGSIIKRWDFKMPQPETFDGASQLSHDCARLACFTLMAQTKSMPYRFPASLSLSLAPSVGIV